MMKKARLRGGEKDERDLEVYAAVYRRWHENPGEDQRATFDAVALEHGLGPDMVMKIWQRLNRIVEKGSAIDHKERCTQPWQKPVDKSSQNEDEQLIGRKVRRIRTELALQMRQERVVGRRLSKEAQREREAFNRRWEKGLARSEANAPEGFEAAALRNREALEALHDLDRRRRATRKSWARAVAAMMVKDMERVARLSEEEKRTAELLLAARLCRELAKSN